MEARLLETNRDTNPEVLINNKKATCGSINLGKFYLNELSQLLRYVDRTRLEQLCMFYPRIKMKKGTKEHSRSSHFILRENRECKT